MKGVRIQKLSGPHFPAFGLNSISEEYLSVFSPNAGTCRPEKLRIQTLSSKGKCVLFWMMPKSSRDPYETSEMENFRVISKKTIVRKFSNLDVCRCPVMCQ